MFSLVSLFLCFLFLHNTKRGSSFFPNKHLGLSLFLPLLFASFFSQKGNVSPFRAQKTSLIWDMLLSASFFFGGGGGVSCCSYPPSCYGPGSFCFSHSSNDYCLCLLFLVCLSFFLMIASLGSFILADFCWKFCSFVSSSSSYSSSSVASFGFVFRFLFLQLLVILLLLLLLLLLFLLLNFVVALCCCCFSCRF